MGLESAWRCYRHCGIVQDVLVILLCFLCQARVEASCRRPAGAIPARTGSWNTGGLQAASYNPEGIVNSNIDPRVWSSVPGWGVVFGSREDQCGYT